jgi:8-oxo-dGTP pyrophosphatase MutT (NUDIX family)
VSEQQKKVISLRRVLCLSWSAVCFSRRTINRLRLSFFFVVYPQMASVRRTYRVDSMGPLLEPYPDDDRRLPDYMQLKSAGALLFMLVYPKAAAAATESESRKRQRDHPASPSEASPSAKRLRNERGEAHRLPPPALPPPAALRPECFVLLPFEKNEGTRRCRYFGTPEGCRQGNDCDYLHIAQHLPEQPEESEMGRLNMLGGKREEGETVTQTAAREVSEETAALLSPETCLDLMRRSTFKMRIPGKYLLHFCHLPRTREHWRLPERYAAVPERHWTAHADRLLWIKVDDLITHVSPVPGLGPCLQRKHGLELLPVSHLLSTLLTRFSREIADFAHHLVEAEERAKEQQQTSSTS